jgi:hypothetical protein
LLPATALEPLFTSGLFVYVFANRLLHDSAGVHEKIVTSCHESMMP